MASEPNRAVWASIVGLTVATVGRWQTKREVSIGVLVVIRDNVTEPILIVQTKHRNKKYQGITEIQSLM